MFTRQVCACLALAAIVLSVVCSQAQMPRLAVTLDATKTYQTVDGFGVNINPAQWHDGKLKPALDLLVDDEGCTLFRLDPTGLACPKSRESKAKSKYGTNTRHPIQSQAVFDRCCSLVHPAPLHFHQGL